MKKATLADAEWKIMQKLWECSPMTLRQLQDSLSEQTGWTKHAIISFLKRMEIKGFIRVDEKQSVREYYPILQQCEAVKNEMNNVIEKFGGKISLVASALIDSQIEPEDLDELMASLQAAKNEGDRK